MSLISVESILLDSTLKRLFPNLALVSFKCTVNLSKQSGHAWFDKTVYPLFTSLKAYNDIKRLSVNLKELFKSPLIILICTILRIVPHHGRGGGSTDSPHLVHVLTTKHEKITSRKVRKCLKKNSATFLAIFQTKCLLGPYFSGPKWYSLCSLPFQGTKSLDFHPMAIVMDLPA